MSKAILNFDVSKLILILLFFILIRQSTTSGSAATTTIGGGKSWADKRLIVSSFNEKLSKEECSTTKGLDEFSCFLNRIVENELLVSCATNDTLCNGEEALNAMLREQNQQKQQTKSEKKIKIKYDYKNQKGLLYYSFDANGTLISLKHQSHKPFIVKTTNQTASSAEENRTTEMNALNEQIADYESNVHLLESLLSTIKKQLKVLTKNKKLLKKMDQKIAKVEKNTTTTTTTTSKKSEKEAKQESGKKSKSNNSI